MQLRTRESNRLQLIQMLLSSHAVCSSFRSYCPHTPIIHPRNLWVRGSNLTGGHNRLSYPRSADTALKPYLTYCPHTIDTGVQQPIQPTVGQYRGLLGSNKAGPNGPTAQLPPYCLPGHRLNHWTSMSRLQGHFAGKHVTSARAERKGQASAIIQFMSNPKCFPAYRSTLNKAIAIPGPTFLFVRHNCV